MRGVLAAAALLLAAPAPAQIDGARRFQLEGGYEQGVANPGPSGPYAFLYYNRPGVVGSSSTLRVALAPVYADVELGLRAAAGPGNDAGLGFSGGGYAFGQTVVDRGDERRGESFMGHGGGPSLSFYPALGKLGPAPLNGVLRVSGSYANYERNSDTRPGFRLPTDTWTGAARAGLRWGGQEPGLDRSPAMEISGWWESRLREHGGVYGLGDRTAERRTDLFWTRVLIAYALKCGVILRGGASAGAGEGVDRFSAYQLGGLLTMNSEFPLILPGYFSQEIAARRYAQAWTRVGLPLDGARRLVLNLFAAGASVATVPGADAGGPRHVGVGAGLEFVPARGALRTQLDYGYSPTAARGGGRGGHAVALSVEINFASPAPRAGRPPDSQQGLRWLLGL